ncbi:MAG: ribosome maturation factor RimM [Chitinispirillaceae bacterium]|jgi:16S rRNA processing protein RimM
MPSAEWIAIGIVKRPVGLRGLCAVEPFGGTLAGLRLPCSIRIGKKSTDAVETSIDEIVPLPNGCRCRFSAKNDRTAVEGLRGLLIFIERNTLPGLQGNSFYQFELKGMDVYSDTGGNLVGTVVEVHNFPSSDTLEVECTGTDSLLLPISDQAITAIDKAGRRITVRQSFIEELLN